MVVRRPNSQVPRHPQKKQAAGRNDRGVPVNRTAPSLPFTQETVGLGLLAQIELVQLVDLLLHGGSGFG
jgi:hypothetical protein